MSGDDDEDDSSVDLNDISITRMSGLTYGRLQLAVVSFADIEEFMYRPVASCYSEFIFSIFILNAFNQ